MATVFFDMDGTLAKWNPSATLSDLYREGYFLNRKPEEKLCAVANELAVMDDGWPLSCYILTSVLQDAPHAKKEKIAWLQKYVPAMPLNRILTVPYGVQKAHFVEDLFHRDLSITDILVDDHSPNLIAWQQAGGDPIKWVNNINNSCFSRFEGLRCNDPYNIRDHVLQARDHDWRD